MANSIVFQSSAEQLKTAVFGYNGTGYQALKVNSNGELDINVGTLSKVDNIGTLNKVVNVGTLSKVDNIGTLNKVVNVGTLSKVDNIGTLNKVVNVGTLSKVDNIGTLSKVVNVGTLSKVDNIGTLNNVVGTVKVNLADRTFTSTDFSITAGANSTTYTDLIDISKYQDTSWYIRNMSNSTNREQVTVGLAVTPSSNLTLYPRVLISETATINNNAKVITNDYYMKYITAQIVNATDTTQTVVIVFNGRY